MVSRVVGIVVPEYQRWVLHCRQLEDLSGVSVRRSLIAIRACVDLLLLPRCMSALLVFGCYTILILGSWDLTLTWMLAEL